MMSSLSLNRIEKRAIVSLSLIMALRMIALFMALPLFALYASTLPGASPTLIGLALGIYGLSQALLQIPFGTLSDRYGRKPIIAIGLTIFIIGSFLSAGAHSIWSMILGRTLQGGGAVGSTLLAYLSDCTRTEKRTIAMAIAGISIGAAFGIGMLVGPLLTQWITVSGLFVIAGLMGILTLILLYTITPNTVFSPVSTQATIRLRDMTQLFFQPDLCRLNAGIFILHAIFSASFVVIPFSLLQTTHLTASTQWFLYLPSLLIAFPLSFVGIGLAERMHRIKECFLLSISTLLGSELLLLLHIPSLSIAILTLTLFFLGFSLLEAFLPSLISRTAPAALKGSALGIYSSAQFFGIFAGGTLGGLSYGYFNASGVYFACVVLCLIWLSFALSMNPPYRLITRHITLPASKRTDWATILASIQETKMVLEAYYAQEEHTVYIKIHDTPASVHSFLQLKETVES